MLILRLYHMYLDTESDLLNHLSQRSILHVRKKLIYLLSLWTTNNNQLMHIKYSIDFILLCNWRNPKSCPFVPIFYFNFTSFVPFVWEIIIMADITKASLNSIGTILLMVCDAQFKFNGCFSPCIAKNHYKNLHMLQQHSCSDMCKIQQWLDYQNETSDW